MKITKLDNIDFELPKDFNMKFIEQELRFNIYKITYTYKTLRGNNKENHKYLVANDSEDARFKFIEFINKYNVQQYYRAISNVKILDVVNIGTVTK